MRFYLAGRYGRIDELNEYATQLRELGHTVSARWLKGDHRAEDAQLSTELSAKIASEDIEDIEASDVLIAFTDPPRSTTSRGGRHCEFGYAMAWGLRLIVIGPAENVFYTLPFGHYPTWEEFKRLGLTRLMPPQTRQIWVTAVGTDGHLQVFDSMDDALDATGGASWVHGPFEISE